MADGVNTPPVINIHQALHGYAEGHRQLALSTVLSAKDQRTLLALSDISGTGSSIDEAGYLTGYPLADSGFYALARTWAATEMPRPGCVWTHTILIGFDELAAIEDLTSLLTFFLRPTNMDSYSEYISPIRRSVRGGPTAQPLDEAWVKKAIGALYGKPKAQVYASKCYDAELFLLSMWSQQWPRLRRSFKFCTWVLTDRSFESIKFDIQLLATQERLQKIKFQNFISADAVKLTSQAWIDQSTHDLSFPDIDGLRTFLKQWGAEAVGGREIFVSLCRLHEVMRRLEGNSSVLGEAIEVLARFGPKQLRGAQAAVANSAIRRVEVIEQKALDFLISNLELIDSTLLELNYLGLLRRAWRTNPQYINRLLNNGDLGARLVVESMTHLTLDEVLDLLVECPALLKEAIVQRPELLINLRFWAEVDGIETAIDTVQHQDISAEVVAAMIVSNRQELSGYVSKLVEPRVILDALGSLGDDSIRYVSKWIDLILRDANSLANYLAQQSNIPKYLLHAFSKALPADLLPNDFGSDPWLIAWNRSSGHLSPSEETFLLCYLMRRAFGWRTKSPAELVAVSFDMVYRFAAASRLEDDTWQLVDSVLPSPILWFTWDRCYRLTAGVASLFVNRELAPDKFLLVTSRNDIFMKLVVEISKKSKGRNYLLQVADFLRLQGGSGSRARIDIVLEVLD
ncbi:hypothetical protein [Pseudomonas coronafaciens]|uniref:GAP1-N1 domain-containing protein n=1 Tax=Pseudomonas coronafaciens TaxID=53409 RepID=UPI000EFFDD79|nr:hypothetical protein [Pseudomonas coronafaciens]RMP20025.1 hypothetical protein ALQ25_02947 [Pseudomonas coronafaciens pv. atropurpurea]